MRKKVTRRDCIKTVSIAAADATLMDPRAAWPEGEARREQDCEPVGRIGIIGSNTRAHAYPDAAIDTARRAEREPLEA